jgi:hypothetical protein
MAGVRGCVHDLLTRVYIIVCELILCGLAVFVFLISDCICDMVTFAICDCVRVWTVCGLC